MFQLRARARLTAPGFLPIPPRAVTLAGRRNDAEYEARPCPSRSVIPAKRRPMRLLLGTVCIPAREPGPRATCGSHPLGGRSARPGLTRKTPLPASRRERKVVPGGRQFTPCPARALRTRARLRANPAASHRNSALPWCSRGENFSGVVPWSDSLPSRWA